MPGTNLEKYWDVHMVFLQDFDRVQKLKENMVNGFPSFTGTGLVHVDEFPGFLASHHQTTISMSSEVKL